MVIHMKTTVEIPNDLLNEAKRVARMERRTLRSLLEEGLRWVLDRRREPRQFQLKQKSVPGKGVQPGVAEGEWEQIRDLIYRGRGT